MTSLNQLFRRKLERHFVRKHQAPAVAEDLAQTVLIKAFLAACSFKGAAAVATWIFRIARHELVNQIRREEKEPLTLPLPSDGGTDAGGIDEGVRGEAGQPFDGPIFDPDVDDHEQLRLIHEAMMLLRERDPERAETLTLSCVEGWSGAQLAEYLERSTRASYEYVNQCKKKLRAAYLEVRQRELGQGCAR